MNFVREENIFSKKTKNVLLLLLPTKSSYLKLNQTASFIWELLQNPIDLNQIAQKLSQKYQIEAARAKLDAQEIINDFVSKGIVKQIK